MSDALAADVVEELQSIDAAREAVYVALRDANARGVTGRDLGAVLVAAEEVEARCVALHRRVWPRHRGRLVVALGDAILVSPTGRSMRLVWRRPGVSLGRPGESASPV